MVYFSDAYIEKSGSGGTTICDLFRRANAKFLLNNLPFLSSGESCKYKNTFVGHFWEMFADLRNSGSKRRILMLFRGVFTEVNSRRHNSVTNALKRSKSSPHRKKISLKSHSLQFLHLGVQYLIFDEDALTFLKYFCFY